MKDFVCRMPDNIHKKIRELSYNNNVSMSEIVRNILDDFCNKNTDLIIKKVKENKNRIKKRKPNSKDLYKLTEPLLLKLWDNPIDDIYNDL